jgi:hypothetical protein
MIGFVIFLIVVVILCYVAKVIQEAKEAKDAKEETNNQSAKAVVEPAISTVPVTSVDKQSSSDDDGELLVVISAAIAAISESANVQILSVRSGGNGWVIAGRQDLMSKL